jgi:hypothetical protein
VDDCEMWSDFVLQVGQDGDDDQDWSHNPLPMEGSCFVLYDQSW